MEVENNICIVCLEICKDNEKIHNEYFCECKYICHKDCFLKYYYENLCCMICKKKDYDFITYRLYNDYKEAYKTFKNIKRFNCDCNIVNIQISRNINIIYIMTKNKKKIIMHHINLYNNYDENDIKYIKETLINNKKYKKYIVKMIIEDYEYLYR